MISYEVKFTIKAFHLTLTVSLLMHAALMAFSFSHMSILEQKVNNAAKFEIDLKEQEIVVASIEQYIAEGEIINPEAHIYILKNSKVAKTDDELSDFFKDLGNTQGKRIENRRALVSRSSRSSNSIKAVDGKKRLSNLAAALFANQYKSNAPKEIEQPLNVAKLKQLITANHNKFRSCYEKGLMRDELLSGNLEVTWSVSSKEGTVDFKGTGRKKAVQQLRDCIKHSSSKLKFPKEFRGKKVKFSLFFSS